MKNKIHEIGTLGWIRDQQKKKFDKKNKIIERWERLGIPNIFKDKGFNDEDREYWFRYWNKIDVKDNIDTCWNWLEYVDIKGYGQFCLTNDIHIGLHRLAYIYIQKEPFLLIK